MHGSLLQFGIDETVHLCEQRLYKCQLALQHPDNNNKQDDCMVSLLFAGVRISDNSHDLRQVLFGAIG